jgi:hypothetical protein
MVVVGRSPHSWMMLPAINLHSPLIPPRRCPGCTSPDQKNPAASSRFLRQNVPQNAGSVWSITLLYVIYKLIPN